MHVSWVYKINCNYGVCADQELIICQGFQNKSSKYNFEVIVAGERLCTSIYQLYIQFLVTFRNSRPEVFSKKRCS